MQPGEKHVTKLPKLEQTDGILIVLLAGLY